MGNEKNSEKFEAFALAFLKESKEDLDTAKELIENKRYSRAVYFSQQCAEKAVKALLEMEKIFVSEHDLSTFFVKFIYNNKSYSEFKEHLEDILESLDYFEGEWSKTRYPKEKDGKVSTPTELYNEQKSLEAIEKAEESLNLIKKILNKKFNII